ncbi:LytTR family DNA-binding domain-containing protein [Sphingomonas sp. R1]|uniref:LytTR family DNA-binding domain-containing protein n=1 Tax=Sphingomonas sp. R1 TaxID=399176 RepID=UPI00222416EE|nr:LytTR family DNA-binding domain-containing protein [Sphingomonas sp. R1]UYY78560.1 LytTR family transcriptional regulator DNA-binding domain-containing protein [Sphingomonas sp. R1]
MPLRRLAAELAILSALTLLLALLGPFGSYATPLAPRLLHWALYLVTGYVFFRPVIAAGGALARQTGLPRRAAIAAACALGAFPTSMVLLFGSAGSAWHAVTGAAMVSAYLQTLIIGATVTTVQLLAGHRAAPAAPLQAAPIDPPPAVPSAEPAAPIPRPALLEQLPPHLRGTILCLENEDHYVRVHTDRGSALILMRMRDAVAQLDGLGERVHRSWWVAGTAVVSATRQDRNWRLRLADGREVPVARTSVAAVRARGWLGDGSPAEE